MSTCMFCEKKGEYAFLWGAGRRWSLDYLCPYHYEQQDWSAAVPIEHEDRLRAKLKRHDGY